MWKCVRNGVYLGNRNMPKAYITVALFHLCATLIQKVSEDSHWILYYSTLISFVRKWNFWLMAIPNGLSLSFTVCWCTMFSLILMPLDIEQKEAGWVGSICLFVSATCNIICGMYRIFIYSYFFKSNLQVDIDRNYYTFASRGLL